MNDLRKLTEEYILHFDQKNLNALERMFAKDVALTDPDLSVRGKNEILDVVETIFRNFEKLEFKAQNIFVDNNTSVIEFSLILNEMQIVGTDIIEWDGNLIKSLRAYLYEKK
jgi:ketosteroid isomerase-like protein